MSCRRSARDYFAAFLRVCEDPPYGRQDRLHGDVVGTSMTYGIVAFEASTLARMLVTWRFEHSGERIEWFPMPGAGWTKD